MGRLRLKNELKRDSVNLSKTFIMEYMPKASGEFLKIYLYIMCCLDNGEDISISEIADIFDLTEKDVLRALNYWNKEGIISIESDGNTLISITLLSIECKACKDYPNRENKNNSPVITELATSIENTTTKKDVQPDYNTSDINYSASEVDNIRRNHSDFNAIVHIVQSNITNGSLSKNSLDNLVYIMDELHFGYDMMEALVQYCVDCGKKSVSYMLSVAISWHQQGYDTVDKVHQNCTAYKKTYGLVMKAFGINNRSLNDDERNYINKWTSSDCFANEIIVEACHRTISQINSPSFKYADGILSSWKKSNVTNFSDIDRLDKEHKSRTSKTPVTNITPASTKPFNNIPKSDRDFELWDVNNSRKLAGLEPITRQELDAIRASS